MMKKALFTTGLVSAIVFLFLLAGCASSPTVSPTPTMQKPSTPTAIATASPQPHYILQRPDFQQLLALVLDIRLQAPQNYTDYNWKNLVGEASLSSLDVLIAGDLHHYYANDLPNATGYIDNIPAAWGDVQVFRNYPSKSLVEILFNHSLPTYLNEHSVHFTDDGTQTFGRFSVKSNLLSEKISQSGEADWLLEINLSSPEILTWLPVHQRQDGKYTVIPNDIEPRYFDPSSSYFFDKSIIMDINNDHKKDAVIIDGYTSRGEHKDISIYTFRNDGFYFLDLVRQFRARSEEYSAEYEIGDHNKDGLLDIQITYPESKPFDCSWWSKTITQFDGEKRTDQTVDGEIPYKPACALASALDSHNPQEIAAFLKWGRANLPKDASPDLRAWIQLRLAMADYAQAKDAQAVQEMAAMDRIVPAGVIQNVVQDARAKSGPSLLKLCETLYSAARNLVERGGFGSQIDYDLAGAISGGSFSFSWPIAEYVCPYYDLVNARLQTIKKDDSPTPAAAFASLGLKLSDLVQADLDGDADPDWLAILGEDTPLLISIYRTNGKWEIYLPGYYQRMPSNLQVKAFDVNGDGQAETLFSYAHTEINGGACPDGKHRFWLQVWDVHATDDSDLLEQDFDCSDQSPLDQLSNQEIINLYLQDKEKGGHSTSIEYPAWAKLHFDEDRIERTILDDVKVLEKAILENKNPAESRTQVETMLKSLPAQDATADVLREQLIYLSGLTYELQGDDEKALAIYLSLIEKNPQSLWSRLAQSRLK